MPVKPSRNRELVAPSVDFCVTGMTKGAGKADHGGDWTIIEIPELRNRPVPDFRRDFTGQAGNFFLMPWFARILPTGRY
jgi:hypothetical protein